MVSVVEKVKGFFGSLGKKISSVFGTLKRKIGGVFGKKTRSHRKKAAPVAPAPAAPAPAAPAPAPAPAPTVAGPTQTAGRKLRKKNMNRMKFYKPKTRRR
jgi:hypothetical protein